MKLLLLPVGKLKERHYVDACDEYYKRIRRRLPFEVTELRRAEDGPRRLPARFELWALEAGGRQLTSEALAAQIQQRMSTGAKGIGFLIGGADGLPAEVAAKADMKLSLSKLTLPHRLVRLILAEQLYRALSIIAKEPYHR